MRQLQCALVLRNAMGGVARQCRQLHNQGVPAVGQYPDSSARWWSHAIQELPSADVAVMVADTGIYPAVAAFRTVFRHFLFFIITYCKKHDNNNVYRFRAVRLQRTNRPNMLPNSAVAFLQSLWYTVPT